MINWYRALRGPASAGNPVIEIPVRIPAESFAGAVVFAISQPEDVDVNEILFRPTFVNWSFNDKVASSSRDVNQALHIKFPTLLNDS
jgi:hypothetical protein